MDPPIGNSETKTRDGIPDGNIDLQGLPNNRAVVNPAEMFSTAPR